MSVLTGIGQTLMSRPGKEKKNPKYFALSENKIDLH
jgi:hypothetical protein